MLLVAAGVLVLERLCEFWCLSPSSATVQPILPAPGIVAACSSSMEQHVLSEEVHRRQPQQHRAHRLINVARLQQA